MCLTPPNRRFLFCLLFYYFIFFYFCGLWAKVKVKVVGFKSAIVAYSANLNTCATNCVAGTHLGLYAVYQHCCTVATKYCYCSNKERKPWVSRIEMAKELNGYQSHWQGGKLISLMNIPRGNVYWTINIDLYIKIIITNHTERQLNMPVVVETLAVYYMSACWKYFAQWQSWCVIIQLCLYYRLMVIRKLYFMFVWDPNHQFPQHGRYKL